jgi:hypothetical protein
MKVATYEATVESGQIRLTEPVTLPERARVYVVVPGIHDQTRFHIYSPRLAHPARAGDFVKEVTHKARITHALRHFCLVPTLCVGMPSATLRVGSNARLEIWDAVASDSGNRRSPTS